jgi:hypothetical protein
MKKLSLVLLLVSSPALADTHELAHPLAHECAVTDTDCVVAHDRCVVALATFMGVASYCKASTTSARCREAVAAAVKAEQLAAKAAKDALETATHVDLSEPPASTPAPPPEPESEFPDVAKKGTL